MDRFERRGTHAGTLHAQDKLKERYGLNYPLSDFLRWIDEGHGTEVADPMGNRAGTKVYDVDAPANSLHPAQTVRCVIGIGATDDFVLTFLPLKWKCEIVSERKEVRGNRNRNHFKEFRRVNQDADDCEAQL